MEKRAACRIDCIAVYYIRYSLREEEVTMASSKGPSQEEGALLTSSEPGKRILVVEDELETEEMLCTYLRFCGYEVLSTAWGKDVLEICRESHPDLIILDFQLPDTDGYEVYRELSDTQQTSHIPVIFLTKVVDDDLKATSLETGVFHYITKPFDLEELERRVRDALC
jgi:two-component system OmpR family response regulator